MCYSRHIKILVAEDNEDSRLFLRFFLESLRYKVIEAENGKEAVRLAEQEKPDLILMDLNMPEMDGVTATVAIRRSEELSGIPIIAVSAYGEWGMELFLKDRQLGEGFIAYITKPINNYDLAEQIEMALIENPKAQK